MPIRTYAQFYHHAVNSDKLIEACGDRSVIILDGRRPTYALEIVAKYECAKRNYIAYQVRRGVFRTSGDTALTDIIAI